ncbi:MAG: hypothetical protein ACRD44_09870 [Bryobacteraceae bacterium]
MRSTTLRSVGKIAPIRPGDFKELIVESCAGSGQRHSKDRIYPAQDVDSAGEVPDSPWYENRHGTRLMSTGALVRGPGEGPPSSNPPWRVVSIKSEGVTPGFQIKDSAGGRYMVKLDPPDYPELATSAEAVATRFFHAFGYHVPGSYIVTFRRQDLIPDPKDDTPVGDKDIDRMLSELPHDELGRYRAVANRFIEGELVGPFHFSGLRPDDPNDFIPHEHRRSLRGLYVMSAWLNNTDTKSGNTLDTVVTENGIRYVKHYLIDFGACLGSASYEPKSPRQGHEYKMDLKPALLQLFTAGVYVPKWARAKYSRLPSVGAFEAETFRPDKWKPNFPNPAFENRLPEDTAWAARKIAAFRDDDIRAIVGAGRYSDPEAAEWMVKTLIARRDKIVRRYLAASRPGRETGGQLTGR